MLRLFENSTKRKKYLLDGLWKFKTDPDKNGVDEKWYQRFPDDSVDIVVPSCWNHELGLYDYEGIAWYTTTFENTEKNINLVFHAVTGQAEVYVDGVHLGSHYGGFTRFNFILKDIEPGKHNLTISVDNTHDTMNTIPLARVDWFHYGGIIRSVEVMELKDIWIKDHRIGYSLNNSFDQAELSFKLVLQNFTSYGLTRNLVIYIDDQLFYRCTVKVNGETNIEINDLKIDNIKLWDILKPNLYLVRIDIEEDDIADRIGFRNISVKDKKILLNGKEIYLKGVNRHEDHPDWGFAMPFKLNKKDMDIIKNLGCNTIRGSHYPNSEDFLDLCDQEGMLFWEEIPMWGYPERTLVNNPLVLERALMMHEEMVKRDYHHPSIFVWGLHNEIDTRIQAAYDITKALAEKVRELDNSRPITYATHHPMDDICYSLVDIISVNKYYGWYDGNLDAWDVFLDEYKQILKSFGEDSKPIIMSEFGAGAIYGDHTFEGPKWTENFQEKLLDYTLRLFHNDPDIVGSYIWQYCDLRTAKQMELQRPRSFNNKGIVNEYRKPKLAYWTVQKIYKQFDSYK